MIFLERRTVSRKTASDGRLEITKPTATRLEAVMVPISVELDGTTDPVKLSNMACTCRGEEKAHVHFFLEADRLKSLEAGIDIELELDETARRVHIRRVDPD
jgi:hypothetical protein